MVKPAASPNTFKSWDSGDYDETDPESYQYWARMLWTAPEILRKPNYRIMGTQKGDIYSFAIILHEIAARLGPWGCHIKPKEIITYLIESNGDSGGKRLLRPDIEDLNLDENLKTLIEKCWSEDPRNRPNMDDIKVTMKKLIPRKSINFVDTLLQRMEVYANNLEQQVEERTKDYIKEKEKCEELLHELLPATVARQLINEGDKGLIAENYDACTIYFSDIVGFTSISATSEPIEIVHFLNDLYTLFDSIIQQNFDVYKVETIGDAYMVVSGLPVPNGDQHASEIARMSLRILENVDKFRIRHKPEEKLKLRIGLHTGPVVAGVVGKKMPRYCLFGDTVNTASRMESNGLPLRIHLSSATADILKKFEMFMLELRGDIDVKGKGMMTTYWLNGLTQKDEVFHLPEIKYQDHCTQLATKFERKTNGSIRTKEIEHKFNKNNIIDNVNKSVEFSSNIGVDISNKEVFSCGQPNEPVKKGVSFTEENEHLGNGIAGKDAGNENFNVDNEASGKGVDYGGREVCFSDVDELHAFL